MRKLYILLFCILLTVLIANPCFSEEAGVDGATWESWSEAMKLGWVVGFMAGVNQASMETYIFLVDFANTVRMKFGRKVEGVAEIANRTNDLFVQKISLSGLDYGRLVTGLDQFYQNYQNKKIMVKEAIYIVKLGLMGAPQEFIEEQTRILRIDWKHRMKEQTSLWDSTEEYKIAWEKWGKYLPFSVSRASMDMVKQ